MSDKQISNEEAGILVDIGGVRAHISHKVRNLQCVTPVTQRIHAESFIGNIYSAETISGYLETLGRYGLNDRARDLLENYNALRALAKLEPLVAPKDSLESKAVEA